MKWQTLIAQSDFIRIVINAVVATGHRKWNFWTVRQILYASNIWFLFAVKFSLIMNVPLHIERWMCIRLCYMITHRGLVKYHKYCILLIELRKLKYKKKKIELETELDRAIKLNWIAWKLWNKMLRISSYRDQLNDSHHL